MTDRVFRPFPERGERAGRRAAGDLAPILVIFLVFSVPNAYFAQGAKARRAGLRARRAPSTGTVVDNLVIGVGARGARRRSGATPDAYLIYGAKLYAPCDGDVVSAADDYADQVPGTIRYEPPYGNHVFIDTGSELVKLAHLRPGTVTVTTGDRVRAGQLLGEVGNSGNTTEPHLHLHAERDGLGLDLRFTGITGSLHRGRTLRT
ncbi:peptidoglycan DD-metalloendopeptidase family protein [Streptomyces sp. NPDC056704]|uniref:peptidoglycan DD-metalloendopeptidase family protein n=1 Tax=Streptomyces sp. NPDC056704 TaxID=3345917 RepID=UPI00368A946F